LANGIIDAFIHVCEQYLTYPSKAEVQDRYSESLLLILKDLGAKVYSVPEPDYDTRANFMWAATNALNTAISMGVVSDWSTHSIGHELTALYGLDHAVTLAIVLPGVLELVRDKRREKLLQYAERIWGISSFDQQGAIMEAIRWTDQFFQCLGVKTRLSDYGIGSEVIGIVEKRMRDRKVVSIGNAGDITVDDIPAILGSRL
jgi:NADP-dependent alcohol dehydrogenase